MIRGYCIGGGVGSRYAAICASPGQSSSAAGGQVRPRLRFQGHQEAGRLVGPSFAKEIFLTARQFDAQEACAMGLYELRRAAG